MNTAANTAPATPPPAEPTVVTLNLTHTQALALAVALSTSPMLGDESIRGARDAVVPMLESTMTGLRSDDPAVRAAARDACADVYAGFMASATTGAIERAAHRARTLTVLILTMTGAPANADSVH